uniref:Trichohyalin-plectin-homology domain-containing protein n=1 Tax=Monopterus albus TaxID=43700 RepID=A0A3Q3JB84_MONAL
TCNSSTSTTNLVKISSPQTSAQRAKFPSSQLANHLILERQKQDAARDEVLEFTRYQQTCDTKNLWLQTSERHFLRRTVQRHVQAAVGQHELRVLLEAEEQQHLQELEDKKEAMVERQAKMREKAKALRGRRESEQQQLISDKLELVREQCEELWTVESRCHKQQVSVERAAQGRSQQEQRRLQRQEDLLFDELWEADRQAKEEWEQLKVLVKEKELREEEARLTVCITLCTSHSSLMKLATRWQLERCFQLKMQRLAREQQEELQLDMSILQQLLHQETEQRQEAAQRKAELHEEQQRYRQYLSEELQKQRREEEETEQLIEEKLKKTWTKREQQSCLQREARNHLMKEVMEARHLQIQHKRKKTRLEGGAEQTGGGEQSEGRGGEETVRHLTSTLSLFMCQSHTDPVCGPPRQRTTCEAYQADLRAQIRHRQQLWREGRAQAQRESQQGLILQLLYDQKKDEILSRPSSHTIAPPIRSGEHRDPGLPPSTDSHSPPAQGRVLLGQPHECKEK